MRFNGLLTPLLPLRHSETAVWPRHIISEPYKLSVISLRQTTKITSDVTHQEPRRYDVVAHRKVQSRPPCQRERVALGAAVVTLGSGPGQAASGRWLLSRLVCKLLT